MKKALLNLNFNPKQASRYEELCGYLAENGYEIKLYPEFNKIPNEEILIEWLEDVDVFIGSSAPFTDRVMETMPQCKIISRMGVGYDSIDVPSATRHGVAALITPGVGAEAVSEYAFTLMAAAARRVVELDRAVRNDGIWDRMVGAALWHKTLGIVGMGRIGKKLVQIAHGFDMKVVAYDMYRDEAFAKENDVTYYDSLDEMLKVCDFVSIHTNLTDETRGLISKAQLELMKPTAILVNTARGGIVNEADLYEALKNKTIAAAGFDVFEEEPMPADHPFRELKNLIISAHNAGSSAEGKNTLLEAAFKNVVAIDNGETPVGLLNPDYRENL